MINYEAAQFWLNIVLYILLFLQWLYVWRSNKDKATKNQLENQAIQIVTLDQRIKNAIGHPELKPIYERMNSMDSRLSEIKGKMHTLDLIHEMLLNEGGQK